MVKWLVKLVFTFALLLGGKSLWAQTSVPVASNDIQKQHLLTNYATARVNYLFQRGSLLYAEYTTLPQFQSVFHAIPNMYSSYDEVYNSFLWVGYEHAITQKWYAGLSGKLNFVSQPNTGSGSFFSRFNFSHHGNIGKLFFYKEFAFEYLSYNKSQELPNTSLTSPQGRGSFSLGLGRRLLIKGKPLYLGVNYRAFEYVDFQNNSNSFYRNRKVNRTKLKFEVNYGFLPHWTIGVYYMRDTEYRLYLGTSGSQATKWNYISDGVGVTLSYLLFKKNPDKHIDVIPAPAR